VMSSLRGLDHRTVQVLDGIALFWVVLWALLAGATGYQIWRLTGLSDTAEVSARAIDNAGRAVQRLSDVPLVGEGPSQLGDQIRETAQELDGRAEQTRGDVRRLSILVGLSTFLVPVSPVAGLYLPLRLSRRREIASIRSELGPGPRPPELEAYLARRALATLSFADLRRVCADPVRDLEEGRHGPLAEAELSRLGLARLPGPAAAGTARPRARP
jgi:hypothetical protein